MLTWLLLKRHLVKDCFQLLGSDFADIRGLAYGSGQHAHIRTANHSAIELSSFRVSGLVVILGSSSKTRCGKTGLTSRLLDIYTMKHLLRHLLSAVGVLSVQDPQELPVCIVGAGPAGLTTAAELELKGKNTVIFEKQHAVGGKCQAVYQEYVSPR